MLIYVEPKDKFDVNFWSISGLAVKLAKPSICTNKILMGLGDPQMDFLNEISMISCSLLEKVEQNEEQHRKTKKH